LRGNKNRNQNCLPDYVHCVLHRGEYWPGCTPARVVTKIGAKRERPLRERPLIVAQEAPSLERGATPYGPKSMKFLYLLRHAKSSWEEPGLNDHDRPLNRPGRNAAKIMATYLRRSEIKPDLVICSTAIRAKQTLDPIVKAINPPKVILERKIYGGTQEGLWE